MTITQFKYIVAVDNHRHFARAAEACFVTQPTLSMQIQKLEEELDILIFDRSKHPIVPTPLGEKLIDQARKVIYESDVLENMAKQIKGSFEGELNLAVIRPYLGSLSEHIAWSDTGISLLSAVLLFSLTAERKPILEWSDTTALPWGILVLFGGGLALAGTLQSSVWFDHMGQFLQSFQGASVLFWLLVMAVLGVFATEFLSNMALVSALLPLVLTLSVAFDIPMELLALPLVLGASCAFMLPMATPPNAIVFSTGKLTVPYMMARGAVLNVIAVAVLTALAYALSFMG